MILFSNISKGIVMKKILSILFIVAFALMAQPAQAVTVPTFPSCTATQGSIIAYYPSGTHGVPGDSTTYTGIDTVYEVDGVRVLQCLCPDNGEGVQTLWWQYDGLSENDLSVLQNQGWIWIANGTAWGLNDAPYLAKNSNFSCVGRGGEVAGSSASTNSSSGVGGASSPQSYGQVLGAQLAATGTAKWGTAAVLGGALLWMLGKDKSAQKA